MYLNQNIIKSFLFNKSTLLCSIICKSATNEAVKVLLTLIVFLQRMFMFIYVTCFDKTSTNVTR